MIDFKGKIGKFPVAGSENSAFSASAPKTCRKSLILKGENEVEC